ncbi:unnamed protein product [Adineta steineri]|uniref:Uncharacterized protein n=1 Tax=Adineta steineri TaxID=433720 RepID=A0A819WMF5_9BILA|nr:unnamed protein product [Adineta steineri]CAF1293003.1 unnamed protein product [Adineta steineri]CAF3499586.1 unnamed protein product [Adineta steineri]CAF4127275.1 unnamed protein product [Adineta steineri]
MEMICSDNEFYGYFCDRDNTENFQSCPRKVLEMIARKNNDDIIFYNQYVEQIKQDCINDNSKQLLSSTISITPTDLLSHVFQKKAVTNSTNEKTTAGSYMLKRLYGNTDLLSSNKTTLTTTTIVQMEITENDDEVHDQNDDVDEDEDKERSGGK